MSATNAARAGKRGNICVGNNVSSFARAFIPRSANMVSKRVIFGAFLFLVSSNFLHFGGVFNKIIIPFTLVGYEIGYSQLGPAGVVGYLPGSFSNDDGDGGDDTG